MSGAVSVVVPAFNRADLIGRTLDALLAQTRPAAEIIVVDDGSTDGTPGLVEASDPRVRLIRQANAGDLAARNAGLREATSPLVAFCDSDDLWEPDFLAEMLPFFVGPTPCRVAFSNFRIIHGEAEAAGAVKFAAAPAGFFDGARPLGPDRLAFDAPPVGAMIRFMPFFPSCLVAERAALLGMGGWDTTLGRMVSSDLVTLMRLALQTPFGVHLRPLVSIRKHAHNRSADVQAMNLGDARALEVLLEDAGFAPFAAPMRASLRQRRLAALETAFARQDFAGVAAIAAMLPRGALPPRIRAKLAVARLPRPLRDAAAAALLRLGTVRARRSGAGS